MHDEGAEPALEDMVVSVPETVLFQTAGDEIVLLNIASGEYYSLNEVGSRIWTLLQQGQSPRKVLDTLLDEYEVPAERLADDIRQFLLRLQSRGLIDLTIDRPT